MPIYEYACRDCGREFEELVFAESENPSCPGCESEKTEKLMSACRRSSGSASGDDFTPPPMPSGGCGSGGG